ncbi:MAG: DinB family protein [Ktedonobacterales bacterium]
MNDTTPTAPAGGDTTTPPISDSTDLFAALASEQRILLDTVNRCSDAQLERKGVVGAWSIKNTLAHLTGWEALVVETLPDRLATGQRPASFDAFDADQDGWNARQVTEHEDTSPKEQIFELENTRIQLVNYLRSLGDETLAKSHPWPGWDGTLAEYILASVCEHEKEHCDAICASMAAMGPDAD